MRVTLLGTGGSAGVPTLGGVDGRGDWGACDAAEPRNRRSRASIVVAVGQGALLVDTGPDMRGQLLDCAIPRIDAILYTHAHADHITGLDDVRILNRLCGHPLDAWGTQTTLDELMQRFPYAFRRWQPPGFYRPVMVPRAVAPDAAITLLGLPIRLFDQDHGFSRSLGVRIGDFAYSTDVVGLDARALGVLAGVDTWVVGCFQRAAHRTHAPLSTVLDWVSRLRPRRTILTHMGVDMDFAWLCANLPAGVEPGFDGMVLELADPGV